MGYHPQVRMHTRCNHDTEKSESISLPLLDLRLARICLVVSASVDDYAYTPYYMYNLTMFPSIIRKIGRVERRQHYACNISPFP
jgi:hypothetical protein